MLEEIESEYVRLVGKVIVDRGESATVVNRGEVGKRVRIDIVLDDGMIPWIINEAIKKD